jgi:hypothetical protein
LFGGGVQLELPERRRRHGGILTLLADTAKAGEFRAGMEVELVNDGPVTIVLDA